jgi:hypothetical protein
MLIFIMRFLKRVLHFLCLQKTVLHVLYMIGWGGGGGEVGGGGGGMFGMSEYKLPVEKMVRAPNGNDDFLPIK